MLSSRTYNQQTGLLICCPISTSIRGARTEVAVNNLEQPCVVAANLIHTLDWRVRKVKKAATAGAEVMEEVLARVVPLIGASRLISG